jgi:hypothetical protein
LFPLTHPPSVILSGIVKVILSYAPGNREPSFSRTTVWTAVHIGTGIVCACLPVCWPLFVRVVKLTQRRCATALSTLSNRDGGRDRDGRSKLSSTDDRSKTQTPMRDFEREMKSSSSSKPKTDSYEMNVRSLESGVGLGRTEGG